MLLPMTAWFPVSPAGAKSIDVLRATSVALGYTNSYCAAAEAWMTFSPLLVIPVLPVTIVTCCVPGRAKPLFAMFGATHPASAVAPLTLTWSAVPALVSISTA